jgi:hypothetical protein
MEQRAVDRDAAEAGIAAIRQAWLSAAADLGVRLTTDDRWEVDGVGQSRRVILAIHDFGGDKGMLVFADPMYDQALHDRLVGEGYGYTSLLSGYGSYDHALFIDTLRDWEWTGSGKPPDWYVP